MSLFGAMNTAVSGLGAQTAAFGNIGDDVANSQTVGFKRVDTSFIDHLTTSTATDNQPGAVVARPDYINNVQGTVTQTDNALNLAISGTGFFAVSRPVGETNAGIPTFKSDSEYTREGDFSINKQGYLTNATGDYLNGWLANSSGTLDQTATFPIQIGQSGYSPVPTGGASLAANLPATPDTSASATPIVTQIPIVDALGREQKLNLTWTQQAAVAPAAANTWNVAVTQTDGTAVGTATISFGTGVKLDGVTPEPKGTIGTITGDGANVTGSTSLDGAAATLNMTANFGVGTQAIVLNLGHFGQSDGLTQFAGTAYNPRSLTQDGVAPGSYNGVSLSPNGDVVVNYDNGQSRTVARIPIVTFGNANELQRQDGQSFTATRDSGAAQTMQVGANGAGTLVSSSVESSNVDIAKEFTNLIVAQRAYTANTKLVTTADDLLQATIDMKR